MAKIKKKSQEELRKSALIFLDVYELKAMSKKEKLVIKSMKKNMNNHNLLKFELQTMDDDFFDFLSGLRNGICDYL